VPEQGQQPVAHEVGRRLVSGEEEDGEHPLQLEIGEPVALVLDRQHCRQQVRVGAAAPDLDQLP